MARMFSILIFLVSCGATVALIVVSNYLLGVRVSLAEATLLLLGFQIAITMQVIFGIVLKLAESKATPQVEAKTETPAAAKPALPYNPFAAPPRSS